MRYDFANLCIDTDTRQLRRDADPVHVSPKAFDLLIILITERPRAVPRRELYDRLWPVRFVVDANLPVLIREIRRALDDTTRDIIRTVHGTGYAFSSDVRETHTAPRTPRSDFLHLLVVDDRQYTLGEGENVVGREPTATVYIPSTSVSRRHALITVQGREAVLTDLESKNGTFVGDERVKTKISLGDGILVRFGEVIVRYRCAPANAPTDTMADR